MKTIQVTDAMFDRLIALSREMVSQDNRGTGTPHLFQIRTDYKVFDESLNGETIIVMNPDWEEIGELNKETVQKICDYKEIPAPDWIDEIERGSWLLWDIKDWLKEQDHHLTSCSIAHKYENGFFTAKGCQAHINGNRHHYDNPTDYLSHAFRNPEMQLVSQFLRELTTLENQERPF